MENTDLTRRGFLGLLGLGAAALVVVPERRFWQVGTQLAAPTAEETLAIATPQRGLWPIPGQPGLFKDLATGQIFNLRDFKESDKYDTITIPAEEARFFSEPNPRHVSVMEPIEGQPGLYKDSETGQIVNKRVFEESDRLDLIVNNYLHGLVRAAAVR